MHDQQPARPAQENPMISIMINILLPVAILNQGSKHLGANGPLIALILALLLPIGYGLKDYLSRGHKNFVSILGVISIVFTGGLALFELSGIWFAVKEAAFPLLLGLFVFASAFTANPMLKMMLWNENILNVAAIQQALDERQAHTAMATLLKNCTLLLSTSFLISSALNFWLARRIFVDIDPSLDAAQRSVILNEQIASMTWQGFAVIALPLMLLTAGVMGLFLRRLGQVTGRSLQELLPH